MVDAARAVAANTPVQLAARNKRSAGARRYDAGLAGIVEVADAQNLLARLSIRMRLARVDVWRALLAEGIAQGDPPSLAAPPRGPGGRRSRGWPGRALAAPPRSRRRAPRPPPRGGRGAAGCGRPPLLPPASCAAPPRAPTPGAARAPQMEGLITNYYEYHFLYINGIHHVESKSIQGASLMKLTSTPAPTWPRRWRRRSATSTALAPSCRRAPSARSSCASTPAACRSATSCFERDDPQPGRDPGPGAEPRPADVRHAPRRHVAAAVRRQPAHRSSSASIPTGCAPTACRPTR